MAAPLLSLRDITHSFGGKPLLTGVDLTVGEGERLCLVGRNGSGKSTLLEIAAGLIEPDRGERVVQGGIHVRYLPQEPDLTGYATTLAFVESALGPHDDRHRALRLLQDLGLTGEEDPARLSGGEARRAAIARVLAPEPDVLLLDEPTNHLDLPAIEWLESEIAASRSAVVLISHDRRFLENLSRATLWLDRGTIRRLDQGFAAFEVWRDQVLEEEERERHKLERKIVMEEDWLRYGVTARRKRNVRRLAALHDLRRQHREVDRGPGLVRMSASEAEASGKLVAEAVGLSKSFGDQPIVRDLTLRIGRGDRLGLVGPNGAGKTTLLNLLTGQLVPDAGTIRHGANLQLVSLDQRRESLDPAATLQDVLTGGRGDHVTVNGVKRHVAGYLQDYLFAPGQARTPVGVLSGGERGRLMLARALARPSNLLVLDEPTNDLDLETLDLLEELLDDYPGTLLIASHDRDFLDRIATSVLVAEGQGRWIEYAGGYSDMVAQRGRGVGAKSAAVKPAGTRVDPREPPAASGPAPPAVPRRKLSFKQKHALATLPGRIAALEQEVAGLKASLSDQGLYARDAGLFERSASRLSAAEGELGALEDEWLELEMLREELGE